MKKLLIIISFLCFSYANAQNINITVDKNLNLVCAFEKVILKNPDHNFETFTKDQIKRDDINKLVIESKSPNLLNIKNLSNFFDKIELGERAGARRGAGVAQRRGGEGRDTGGGAGTKRGDASARDE